MVRYCHFKNKTLFLRRMIDEKDIINKTINCCRRNMIAIIFVLFIFACRFSTPIADFYALHVYPLITDVLSFISSPIPLSIQEITCILIVFFAIAIIAIGIKKKWGFCKCLRKEILLVIWVYIWFYMSWCNNYSRSSIFYRTGTHPIEYNDSVFMSFVNDYIDRINANWTSELVTDNEVIEKEIKDFYSNVDQRYGLSSPRQWHHQKKMLFRRFYSAVGVAGFMAPLYSESFVNSDVLPFSKIAIHAHEYSHLLGVSNEAEANFWAFHCCVSSNNQAIRYSGYYDILPHVLNNARRLLSEEDYYNLFSRIRPEIIKDIKTDQEHWQTLRYPLLDNIQSTLYDLFLKGNRITSGRKNYSEVILLLLSIEYNTCLPYSF